ncbi:UNVERIFIED_CONTAM: hypothetical protein FKN15_053221 [Acipenser sinensis]
MSATTRDPTMVYLSMVCHRGQLGVAYYDTADYSVHYMPDTQDDFNLKLLDKDVRCGGSPQVYGEKESGGGAGGQQCEGAHPRLQTISAVGNNLVYIDHDTYCVLQIFKAEPHPSIYKLASGVKEGMSLYGILNRCKSKFGSRLMRRWFLRPTRDLAVLNMRQEVIEFFTSPQNNQVLTTLQDCLKNIKGIPAMLRRMTLSNTKVSDWQTLYKISYNAVCIRDTVSSLPQSVQLFREISQAFSEDLHYISSLISKVVYLSMVCHRGQLGVAYYDTADYSVHYMPDTQDDFNLKLLDKGIEISKQRVLSAHLPFVPASLTEAERITYLSSLLPFDCLQMAMLRRMTLSNTKVSDWQTLYKISYNAVCIRDTVSSLPQSVQLFREISQAFSEDLHYISSLISKVIGFLLSVPRIPSMDENKDFEIEGLDFMFLSEDRLHYRSQRTKELDTMLGDLHCEIRDLETAVMTQLQEKVVEKGPVLYQVMEYSAQLDCLISLALASREFSYCRPTLSTEHSISIRDCRHPLVEMCTGMYVSNPVLSSADEGKMKVITGPNSCGKSVYLKQVGLAVFMALVGSNVPASEAHIGLVDGIYTRMQSRESVSVGLSTFMIDLNQMACAVNNATERSLVLIDEFGKGTNTVDGLSLLASSLRHWLHPGQACPHVFISTNFHSLFQLNLLPESPLLSYQTLETAVDGEELVFFYQLREGVSTSSYAANIATLAGMPAKIVQRGVEVRGADTHLEPGCEAALQLPMTSIF